jgi:hypothetical protein
MSAQARKRSARDRHLVSTMRDETATKRLQTAEVAIEWPTIAIERPSFVIGAVRDVTRWPVCTIWRVTPGGVARMFFCGRSEIAVAPRPIAQRRPTIASGPPRRP